MLMRNGLRYSYLARYMERTSPVCLYFYMEADDKFRFPPFVNYHIDKVLDN